MNKAIFLDRDGTINVDFGYVSKPEQLQFLPGVIDALRIFQQMGYLLIVISNQSGIGRGYFSLKDAELFNQSMAEALKEQGVVITDFFICPHAPEETCECRKPSPYMVLEAIKKYNICANKSYMFGDKASDVECGTRSDVPSFRVTNEHSLAYWADELLSQHSQAQV